MKSRKIKGLWLLALCGTILLGRNGLESHGSYYFAAAGGGGGGPANFSDTFGGTLAAWTVEDGGADINSGRLRLTEGSFGENFIIHNTSIGSTSGYLKVERSTDDSQFPQIPFRVTDAASECYYLEFGSSTVDWYHTTALVGGTDTQINAVSGSMGWASPAGVGITWEGTGTSTTIRIWMPVTSDTPDSVSSWDSSGPDVTFTDNPADAADTGTKVGMGGVQSAANLLLFDDFFAGGF